MSNYVIVKRDKIGCVYVAFELCTADTHPVKMCTVEEIAQD